MSGDNFIKVNVNVGGKMQEIMMEKGTSFSNNGGEYCVFDDGTLKFKPTKGNVWQDAKQIEMKKYQWQVFQNVADNDGDVGTYSKADIKQTENLYSAGEFTEDIKQGLPEGFKISKQYSNPAEDLVRADVRLSEDVGATLSFAYDEYMLDIDASQNLFDSYKDVSFSIPDQYGNNRDYQGKGTITTKEGLTTMNVYDNPLKAYQPCASVTKDTNGRIVSSYICDDCGREGMYVSLVNYTYDSSGRLTSKIIYNGIAQDMKGNGTEVSHYAWKHNNVAIEPTIERYEYDEKGTISNIERIEGDTF